MKDISDYYDIKLLLEKMRREQNMEVFFDIPQAKEITFYILGYWLKLARKDNFKFHIYIANPYLYNNFLNMGLNEFFKVTNGEMEQYLSHF